LEARQHQHGFQIHVVRSFKIAVALLIMMINIFLIRVTLITIDIMNAIEETDM
jgi:hypothetical protein